MKLGNLCAAAICTVVAAGLLAPAAYADNFSVVYSPAGAQVPATTNYEDFNNFNTTTNQTTFNGSGITGTYSGNFSIVPADQYGGAGGSSSYLIVDFGNTATLTLSKSVSYFGLWFSALDISNELDFYSGTTEVYSFTPAIFAAGVGACTGSNPYCGNPNASFLGDDSGEQFAYINLTDLNGTFDSIVFHEQSTGRQGNFEADNNAILVSAPRGLNPTPEPSSLMLLGTGITTLAGVVRRRMRK